MRDRIEASDEIEHDGRVALLDFSDERYLLRSEYGDHRHLKLLWHCTRMAEHVGGIVDALEDHDVAADIIRWINRTSDNEETNGDYRIALRVFGRLTGSGSEDVPPESIGWIPSETPRTYDPSPNPTDMLHWEENAVSMIEETRTSSTPRSSQSPRTPVDGVAKFVTSPSGTPPTSATDSRSPSPAKPVNGWVR